MPSASGRLRGLRLEGKRALVTGSSQGIGAAIAKLFAKEGAHVVLNHRPSNPHSDAVVKSIERAGGTATLVHSDVSDPSSVSKMFTAIRRDLGGLDVLVNAAGLSDSRIWNAPLSKITPDMWRKVFAVDAFGTFLCTQGAARLMKRGSIVNVASTPAIAGDSEGLLYASAKGAVLSMTRMLAKVLAPRIRVNCMAFGSIETTWVDWLDKKQLDAYRAAIPLRRFGKPEEAASLALFLASEESSFITGQVVVLDGGEVSR
ncbi:MAG: SDR family oxidoreductase [Thaumarchaeota archaeon]|nr:SDR family oxidoreductase [Nitrososphaerota archaeon]